MTKTAKILIQRDQRGVSLLEVTIAVAVLAVLAVGFLGAINGSIKIQISIDERETAKNLAESQMEYIKTLPFYTDYVPGLIPGYETFTVDIIADDISARDANLQKITIVVDNRHGQELVRLSNYKLR